MKIGIIGNGFVGKATQIFAKPHHRFEILPDSTITPIQISDSQRTTSDNNTEYPFFRKICDPQDQDQPQKVIEVMIYDIRPEACVPLGITLEQLDRQCDLIFFCLPTPLHHDGSCYTQILEDTIRKCNNPFKIIRSTIPVGFAAKYGCYFMPEFLTEANWENDFRGMKQWVVGIPMSASMSEIDDRFKELICELITTSKNNGSIEQSEIIFCDTNEAEMLKMMKNCFLSGKVSLMNEFYDFCQATHTDYTNVTEMAKMDARMGTSHFRVPGPDGHRGFGGTCFPKDTHSIYCQMEKHGMNSVVFPAILTRNDTMDRKEREWARDVWRTTIPLPTPTSKVIVVFDDGESKFDVSTVSDHHSSTYLMNIVTTNLSQNNVVILITKDTHVSLPSHPNLLIKVHRDPKKPLFFPQVNEAYYCRHKCDDVYNTMHGVLNIIDLWKQHEQMILYVIKKNATTQSLTTVVNDESGTEGFDSDDCHDNDTSSIVFDYAKMIEEYYQSVLSYQPNQSRKLIVLF